MRRWLVIIVAAPVVLWSMYWGAAAFVVKQGAENFLQDQADGDLSSRFRKAELQGFPTKFQLTVSDIEFRNAALFSWTTPTVQMSAPSYKPQNISLAISGPQMVQSHLGALEIKARSFNIGLFFRPELSLPLGRALLKLETAQLAHQAGWQLNIERLLVMFQEITTEIDGADAPEETARDYRLELDARRIDLSVVLPELPPEYHDVTAATADALLSFSRTWSRAVLEQGLPDLRQLVVRQAEVLFGNTTITLSGQLEASQDGVVSGQIVADIRGWHDLLKMLRQTGYMDPDMADLILETLGDEIEPEETLEIPLKIESGMVKFGIFSLGLLPSLP